MKRKINRFLFISVISGIAITIFVFSWVTTAMSQKTTNTIDEIGEIYMSELNKQIQEKFTTVIEMRTTRLEGIIRSNKVQGQANDEDTIDKLKKNAQAQEFEYLALATKDGQIETIYGKPLIYHKKAELLDIIRSDVNNVTEDYNTDNEHLFLITAKGQYKMKNGKTSDVVIAGGKMNYLSDYLFLENDDTETFSLVVDDEGKFVIRTGGAFRKTYFERIDALYDEYNGKTPAQYKKEIKNSLKNNKDYSTVLLTDGELKHLYCSVLPNSEWHIISVMSFGNLDDAIYKLDDQRITTMIIATGSVLLVMLVIFVLYYRLSRQQMYALETSKEEATRANLAKSEFLSNMSHDIRTPMNAIVGMTEIALKNKDDQQQVENCLDKIKLSSKHLLGLINDVLDMSKIESGKMSLNIDVLSLRDTMSDIVNIMQPQFKSKNQSFDIFIRDIKTENVLCDSVRLNQVLLNILSNAYKFTPENGTIRIHFYQEESTLGENYVKNHFIIQDNGIGMSKEFQKKIFDSFEREETQVNQITGTGLGMAITKYIMDMMKGNIEVKSQLGEGTEFHLTLDLEKAQVDESEMILPPCNVLVVDNNEQLCEGVVSTLKELGLTAEYVLSGEEAVKIVKAHNQNHDDYDFVLIDWKMPGMNGLRTIQEIRNHISESIPIFLISAYDWSDIEEQASSIGVSGFISKPLFKSTLYYGLKRYIDKESPDIKQTESFDFSNKRLLIAEDNDLNYEIAMAILSDYGFEIERAENGQVCVQLFEQSEVGYYDGILMDIRMPIMDGYTAAQNIRASTHPDHDLPIIAMSADAFAEDIQRSLDSGMNAHTAKPINIDEVLGLLQKYMKGEK